MNLKELFEVGAHFGHMKSRLNPKMNRYIWGIKNGVFLIDLSKTEYLAARAAKFLEQVAADQKTILWVGTKKAARDAINEVSKKLNMPYVSHRWIGGTLSNYSQVKKSVTKLLHYEDILTKSEKFPLYTKKELNTLNKCLERLKKNIGGIRSLAWPIGAVVLVDVVKEMSALKEAATVGIPVVAIADTNGDPTLVDYVIPANDDSVRSVKLIVEYLGEAAQKGQKLAKEAKKAEEAAKAAQKDKEAKEKKEKLADKKVAKVSKEDKIVKKVEDKKKSEKKVTAAKPATEKSSVSNDEQKTVKDKKKVETKKKSETAKKGVESATAAKKKSSGESKAKATSAEAKGKE